MPTEKQAVNCFIDNDIFILAGEDIQILIDRNGEITIL
jgi:hypothetical protein